MLALSRDNDAVTVSELSAELGVSKPSTNSMIKRLSERGLLEYERYRPLRLTEAGRREAALVVRKHRLTEMFLVKKMGFGWEEVHPIAEQIEHIDSPAFFERMDELLGAPDFDPHGSPIPDRQGNVPENDRERLSECNPNDVVTLCGLQQSSPKFLRYLDDKGLQIDTVLTVDRVDAYDRSVELSYAGRKAVLPESIAEQLLIVRLPRAPSSGSATK